LCRDFDPATWPPKWKRKWEAAVASYGTESSRKSEKKFAPNANAIRRFRAGKPIEEPTILLVFFAVGIQPEQGVDYELARPIIVPEAPLRQLGAYVHRSDLEEEVLSRIEFQLRSSDRPEGLLLSIEGGDGAGKTRFALEILNRLTGHPWLTKFLSYEHVLVHGGDDADDRSLKEFFELLSKSLVSSSVPRSAEAMANLLAGQRMVLVLDNLETVLCLEVSKALDRIIEVCPLLVILCTSQLPVGARPENTFNLNGGLPNDVAEELLRTRMSEVLPPDSASRRLTKHEIQQIVSACHNIPAAIEDLAAIARTPLQPMRVAEELKRIANGVTDRLDITGHFERVRESTSLWGYREIERWAGKLSPQIQRVFRICGIFAGPFTIEDFEAVAGRGEARWLTYLQSAYVISADPESGVWTQDPFRRGIAHRLLEENSEADEITRRFLDHFYGLLHREGPHVGEPGCPTEFVILSQPNWIRVCYLLGERIQNGDLEAAKLFHEARDGMHTTAYCLGWDIPPLLVMVERASQEIGATICQADCARGLGLVNLCFTHDIGAAVFWYQKALRLYQETGDRWGQADALRSLGDCFGNKDRALALTYLEEALSIVPEDCRLQRAWIERRLGSYLSSTSRGEELVDSARSTFLSLGLLGDMACCDMDMAHVIVLNGDLEDGLKRRSIALQVARTSGNVRLLLRMLLEGLDWQLYHVKDYRYPYVDRNVAREEVEEAFELSERYGDQIYTARVWLHRSALLTMDGFDSEAAQYLRRAISVLEHGNEDHPLWLSRKRLAGLQVQE